MDCASRVLQVPDDAHPLCLHIRSRYSLFRPLYFVPLFFQFTRGDGALDAGVRLLPFIIPYIVVICVNGGLMFAYGLYMPWYTI